MKFAKILPVWLGLCLCLAGGMVFPASGPDPLSRLKRFSDLAQPDLTALAAGEILSQRGALMNEPHGIWAQFCFFVPTPPEEFAGRLQTWDPSRHESLKVYTYRNLGKDCSPNSFRALHLDPAQRPMKRLLDKTVATTAGKSDLNLSRSEARELAACVGKNHDPAAASSCWGTLLACRADAFRRRGLSGVLPYELGNEPFSPAAQLPPILTELPRIAREFAPVLQGAGITIGDGSTTPLVPNLSWSLFDADHNATLNLGASYLLADNDRYQLLFLEYYVSGTYYTAATLYEIWPLRVNGIAGSLVWRGDFFAAPMLRVTKGIERIAYGAIMIQEIKKEIGLIRKDLGKPAVSQQPAGRQP